MSAHFHMREIFSIVRNQTGSPRGLLFTQGHPLAPAPRLRPATPERVCQAGGHVELTGREVLKAAGVTYYE